MTVHASQGQTFDNGVIVSCSWGQRLAYVAASRAKCLNDVAFLMKFKLKTHAEKCEPPRTLTAALARLEDLHHNSVQAVDDLGLATR